jgi:hypothetical protein
LSVRGLAMQIVDANDHPVRGLSPLPPPPAGHEQVRYLRRPVGPPPHP